MLPFELLRVRFQKGKVRPAFLDVIDDNIKLAEKMITIFFKAQGKKKKLLNESIEELEDYLFDYKLVRGLAALLSRRAVFTASSSVEPQLARAIAFKYASVLGFGDRKKAISLASEELKIKPEELENALFADVDDELILTSFQPLEADQLVRLYNLSLAQTLLFKCTRIDFTVADNWKRIFSSIKRNGLMYSIQKADELYTISVNGPLSIFKMTERYGSSMAKLLPEIIASHRWQLNAEILWRSKNRIFNFELSNEDAWLFPKHLPEDNYDSSIERRFAEEFSSLDTGWRIRREPEPLIAGSSVFIPDFSFERSGRKIYFEIVGFWTKDYIEKKIKKLMQINCKDIILAVDESLACSKVEELHSDLILYKGNVPVKRVLERLEKVQEDIEKHDMIKIETLSPQVREDIVNLSDMAKSLAVPQETLRKYFLKNKSPGYVMVGDSLVAQHILDKLAVMLKGVEKLSDALTLVESNGITYPYDLLKLLGYKVKWAGLSVELSTIEPQE